MPLAFVLGVAVLALSMAPAFDGFVPRMLLFYAGTSAAYVLMPYVRRGDIPLVASWVILISELAPCVTGDLISPNRVAADALGVLMAAAPIYLARMRQVMQGDVRAGGRRATDPSR